MKCENDALEKMIDEILNENRETINRLISVRMVLEMEMNNMREDD